MTAPHIAPGRFDLDVVLDGEQCCQPSSLPVGEQIGAGVQRPPGPVQRVVAAASSAVQLGVYSAAALIQGLAGEADDV